MDPQNFLPCSQQPLLLVTILAQINKVYYLTHCATNPKVAGSIPDGVTGIFQWINPPRRIVALGSTQPLPEMSTRNPSWG